VEEADKLQTLLASCCSGWRRRRLCSAHHAASAATTVPGVYVEHAWCNAERRRPDEAWNRGFAALVGRNHPLVWCAIESLQQRRRHCCRLHVTRRRPSISRCLPRFCSVNCTPSVQHDVMARRRWKRPCVRSRRQSASSESDSDTLLTIHYSFSLDISCIIMSSYFSDI